LNALVSSNSTSSGGGVTQADLHNSTNAILGAIGTQTSDLNSSITSNANDILGWVQPLTQTSNKTLSLSWSCTKWVNQKTGGLVCMNASIIS
jgi:hypothetical protein